MRNLSTVLTILLLFLVGNVGQSQESYTRQVSNLVVLTDGSVLPSAVTGLTDSRVQLMRLFQPEQMTVPLSAVAGIVFSRPVSEQTESRLVSRILQNKSAVDTIINATGQEFTGSFDVLDGYVLKWKNSTGTASKPITQVRAIIFSSAGRKEAENVAKGFVLAFQDGSILYVSEVNRSKGIVTVRFPWSEKPYEFDESEIVREFKPFNGDWLDELKPIQTAVVPFWSAVQTYRVNADANGNRLRANTGRYFLRGFGVSASTRLTFKLDENKQYTNLSGYVARPFDVKTGSVRFRVFTDGTLAGTWTLSASDNPIEINISLKGKQRLDLVVDFADDSPIDDRAVWGEMRLVRRSEKRETRSENVRPHGLANDLVPTIQEFRFANLVSRFSLLASFLATRNSQLAT